MTRARAHSGFTLIELVLVLALLAMLFAMATPAMRGFGQGQKLENEVDRLFAAATWARTEAIATAVPHRLEIEPDGSGYLITCRTVEAYEPVAHEFGTLHTLPTSMRLTGLRPDGSALPAVEFHPNGRITPVTLTVAGPNDNAITLQALGAADPIRRVERSVTP